MNRHRAVWMAVWPVLGIAALEASLGLLQYFGANREQDRWGTYANHNHFAGFLEMSLPFAVMYPVALLCRPRPRSQSSIVPILAACGIWAVAAIIFTGIAYSFSRMGFIAALSSLFVMGILALVAGKRSAVAGSRTRRSLATLATLVFASFAFLPPDRLIQRFAHFVSADGLTDEGRSGLWVETIPLIKAYPVFGCGLAGYETAFSRFKISGMLVTDDYVHNDYLQLLAELGLAGFMILATLVFSVVRAAVRGAAKSPEPEVRYFAVACAGSLVAILLHSFADFNLYIPANAMLLAWIAGVTMASDSLERTTHALDRLEQTTLMAAEAAEVSANY